MRLRWELHSRITVLPARLPKVYEGFEPSHNGFADRRVAIFTTRPSPCKFWRAGRSAQYCLRHTAVARRYNNRAKSCFFLAGELINLLPILFTSIKRKGNIGQALERNTIA